MSSYNQIRDVWVLGRTKTKYYGAYFAGFLERARTLLVGGNPDASVWHIPGGKAKEYNGGPAEKGGITLSGFGKNDITIDIDPECKPDYCLDVRDIAKTFQPIDDFRMRYTRGFYSVTIDKPHAILIDRPYSEEDAEHYAGGAAVLPDINQLLKDCLQLVRPGGHVGVIDYIWPHAGKQGKEIAVIAVGTGRNNRARWFTVWRKINEPGIDGAPEQNVPEA